MGALNQAAEQWCKKVENEGINYTISQTERERDARFSTIPHRHTAGGGATLVNLIFLPVAKHAGQ